jgi:uncharacterized protein (DUF302 family)
METPPVTVLIHGHAKGGAPMMLAIPAALEIPLPILVRQREDGQTVVANHLLSRCFIVQVSLRTSSTSETGAASPDEEKSLAR